MKSSLSSYYFHYSFFFFLHLVSVGSFSIFTLGCFPFSCCIVAFKKYVEYSNANIFNYVDFRYVLIPCDFLHIKNHQPETTRNSRVVKYVSICCLLLWRRIHSMGTMDMPEREWYKSLITGFRLLFVNFGESLKKWALLSFGISMILWTCVFINLICKEKN